MKRRIALKNHTSHTKNNQVNTNAESLSINRQTTSNRDSSQWKSYVSKYKTEKWLKMTVAEQKLSRKLPIATATNGITYLIVPVAALGFAGYTYYNFIYRK